MLEGFKLLVSNPRMRYPVCWASYFVSSIMETSHPAGVELDAPNDTCTHLLFACTSSISCITY